MSERKKTWQRRMDDAKRKHRPKLKDWGKDGFAQSRAGDFDKLSETAPPVRIVRSIAPFSYDSAEVSGSIPQIDRINCAILTANDFVAHYEKPYKPCVIAGIPASENWIADLSWSFTRLKELNPRLFKVGEDDDGYKVKVRMKYFLKYLRQNTDDSPLYIFDSNFDTDAVSKVLLSEYRIPSYFSDDLFHLVGEKRRPPYRWFLVGPKRSGTCIHIDPLGTSAWNTLLKGRKRWVLFPPHTSKKIVKGTELIKKGEDDEACNFFVDILPRIKEKHGGDIPIIEFIQHPGETVFVPGGWWHAVINVDDTIAVTQNFCSRSNFDSVWRKTRTGRKKMAVKWLRKLRESYPDLADRADRINTEDNFVMYGDHPKADAVGAAAESGRHDSATAPRDKMEKKGKKHDKSKSEEAMPNEKRVDEKRSKRPREEDSTASPSSSPPANASRTAAGADSASRDLRCSRGSSEPRDIRKRRKENLEEP